MDRRFGCHLFILVFVIFGFDNIQTLNIERDVIFTPNQTTQVAGKTLYYNPNELTELEINNNRYNRIDDYIVEQNEENRWLEPLKHSLYLMLNNKINSNSSKSDVISDESIQRARFLELEYGRDRNNKFGDVINLVNGKLEMDHVGQLQLVEINENCIQYCLEESFEGHNITAFWSIYKIRHRDDSRGYRYEWKITVRRLRSGRFEGKRNTEHGSNVRSFLIKDADYPKYFETSAKKKAARMDKRIFNTLYDTSEHPFQLDYSAHELGQNHFDRGVENLNTGEYYAKGSSPVTNYHVRSPDRPENPEHVHHHYFLNKDEIPLFKSSHFEKVSTFPGHYNTIAFPNNGIQSGQVSVPRVHSQLDSYGEVLQTTAQTPFHFPDELKLHESIRPTTYRGHYDDNRESILEGEVKKNNFDHDHNHNPSHFAFPTRHANVIPLSGLTTTSPAYTLDLNTLPAPSIQSLYNKQYPHAINSAITQNHAYWLNHSPHNHNLNFVGSFPYHENTYSELDPIYHGPTALSTPADIPSSQIPQLNNAVHLHGTDARFVSQLPLQNVDNVSSYDDSTEVHQTTSTNTEPSYTTPFNIVSTTRAVDKKPIPDSINAQLPPPDSGADIRVPYVEIDKSTPNRKKNKKTKPIKEDDDISIEKQELAEIVEKTTKKSTHRYKSAASTEKPSWAPKRPRLRSSDKYKTNSELAKNSERKSAYANRRKLTLRRTTTTTTTSLPPTTVTQEFSSESETVSTTIPPAIEDEPRTSQSVRKSVSVHIQEKVTAVPKKAAHIVLTGKNGEINHKPRRVAKVKKVAKSIEDSTERYSEH